MFFLHETFMPRHTRARPFLGTMLIAIVALGGGGHAQDVVLPPIMVTAPSPITPGFQTGGRGDVPMGQLVIPEGTFAPLTFVPKNEIERSSSPAKTLGDMLADKPGISSSSFAPGAASRPVIRGLDNFRVRIQENGIGAQDVSTLGEDHAVPIDPLAADRVEVIRGPATLRYGSQAIGGVVSAENNRVPTFIPENGIAVRSTLGMASVDHGFQNGTQLDAGFGNAAIHADFFKKRADDYRIPFDVRVGSRVQLNSAHDSSGEALGGSYIFENGYAGIAYSHFQSLYQIPGIESSARFTRIDLNQDKVVSKGEIRPPASGIEAIRFWLGASNYKHNELGLDDDGMDGVRATFKNQQQEARVEAQHVPVPTALGVLNGAVGIQYGHRSIGTSGEAGGLLAPTQSNGAATYVFEELRFTDATKLQAAARIEKVRVGGVARDFPSDFLPAFVPDPADPTADPLFVDPADSKRVRHFTPMSASLGFWQKLPYDLIATINGQYVERAPEAPELFSRGAHDAPGTFEIGNPNLKMEVARSVEIGLKRATGPVRFDASAYYTKYSGFIFKRSTGIRCGDDFATCGIENELTQVVYSQRDATFRGAEFLGQVDIVPIGEGFAGISGQYDIVRATFDDGTNVPRIPPQRIGGGVFVRADGWFAQVGLLHAYAQNDVAPNETRTPGYNNLRAEVSYTKKLPKNAAGLSEVTVGIVGNNLLDDVIRNSVSFKKDEVLLLGRDVRGFVTAKF
jgi:iron complex outermembrane recepter protein